MSDVRMLESFIVNRASGVNGHLLFSKEVTVEVEEASDYVSPQPNGHYYFAENFDDAQAFKKKWMLSEAKKEGIDEDIAKYDGKFRFSC